MKNYLEIANQRRKRLDRKHNHEGFNNYLLATAFALSIGLGFGALVLSYYFISILFGVLSILLMAQGAK